MVASTAAERDVWPRFLYSGVIALSANKELRIVTMQGKNRCSEKIQGKAKLFHQ